MISFIVIDDEALALEAFLSSVSWENYGFQPVGTAPNGRRGLELIREVQPDVVFTDIKMPVMDGIELCEKVSTEFPEIKLVLLTAYNDFEYAQRAFQYGVSDYILKNQIGEERLAQLLGKLNRYFVEKETQDKLSDHSIRQSLILGDKTDQGSSHFPAPEHVICLFVSVEVPFLEKLIKEEPEEDLSLLDSYRWGKMIYGNLRVIDVLFINNNTRLFLGEEAEGYSGKTDLLVRDLIQDIKEKYAGEDARENGNGPLQLTFLFDRCRGTLSSIETVLDRMIKFHRRSQYSYHNDFSPFTQYVSLYPHREWHRHKVQEMIAELKNHVDEHNTEEAGQSLKQLEDYYQQPTYYGPAFIYTCSSLYDLLNNLLAQKKMDSAAAILSDHPEMLNSRLNEKEIYSWFTERILELCKLEKIQISGDINKRIKEVMLFVTGNYDKKLTAAVAAEKAGLSETYFNNLFKKETGISFATYLMNVRIEAAKHLLRHSDNKIYEIADKCGFSRPQYFAQVFEKETGYSPLMYRRLSKVDYGSEKN